MLLASRPLTRSAALFCRAEGAVLGQAVTRSVRRRRGRVRQSDSVRGWGRGKGDESVGGTGEGEGAGIGGWVRGVRASGEVGAAERGRQALRCGVLPWALTPGPGRFPCCHTHHLVSPAAGAPEPYLLGCFAFQGGEVVFFCAKLRNPLPPLSCAGF